MATRRFERHVELLRAAEELRHGRNTTGRWSATRSEGVPPLCAAAASLSSCLSDPRDRPGGRGERSDRRGRDRRRRPVHTTDSSMCRRWC